MIGRQIKRRQRSFELLLPVGQLLLQHRAIQPFSLPARIIRVTDRWQLQGRSFTFAKTSVEVRQLAIEHTHGPPIADDVVHGYEQQMVLLAQIQEDGAKER